MVSLCMKQGLNTQTSSYFLRPQLDVECNYMMYHVEDCVNVIMKYQYLSSLCLKTFQHIVKENRIKETEKKVTC